VDKLVGVPLDKKLQTAKTVPPSQVSVTVMNEANRDHVATNNTNMLSQAGFLATVGPDTDQRTDQTAIEYPDGMQAQAKTLGRYVPGAVLELSSSVSKITLVLGSDGISASATPPATQPKPKTSTSAKPPSSPSPSPSGVTNAAQNSASCIN